LLHGDDVIAMLFDVEWVFSIGFVIGFDLMASPDLKDELGVTAAC